MLLFRQVFVICFHTQKLWQFQFRLFVLNAALTRPCLMDPAWQNESSDKSSSHLWLDWVVWSSRFWRYLELMYNPYCYCFLKLFNCNFLERRNLSIVLLFSFHNSQAFLPSPVLIDLIREWCNQSFPRLFMYIPSRIALFLNKTGFSVLQTTHSHSLNDSLSPADSWKSPLENQEGHKKVGKTLPTEQ